MTEMEKQLVSFARLLLTFVKSCKAGTAEGADEVKKGFQGESADTVAGLINASGEISGAPWTLMHSWSTVLEVRTKTKLSRRNSDRLSQAFAMTEIALSPYKPVSGKKAKKGQSSNIPPQVRKQILYQWHRLTFRFRSVKLSRPYSSRQSLA
jgi:hypothetical protein